MIGHHWVERGLERGGEYHIARDDWMILPHLEDGAMHYHLYRGIEAHGIFPDAHEAAVHADTLDAALHDNNP